MAHTFTCVYQAQATNVSPTQLATAMVALAPVNVPWLTDLGLILISDTPSVLLGLSTRTIVLQSTGLGPFPDTPVGSSPLGAMLVDFMGGTIAAAISALVVPQPVVEV